MYMMKSTMLCLCNYFVYMHTQYEAIPESLKNMLLVMSTQGIFDSFTISSSQSEVDSPKQRLWERIGTFLPNFIQFSFQVLLHPFQVKPHLPPVSHDTSMMIKLGLQHHQFLHPFNKYLGGMVVLPLLQHPPQDHHNRALLLVRGLYVLWSRLQ